MSDGTELVEWLIVEAVSPDRPLLIDADGLNALASLGCETARRAGLDRADATSGRDVAPARIDDAESTPIAFRRRADSPI